jgi:anti-sigma B factor antagonist
VQRPAEGSHSATESDAFSIRERREAGVVQLFLRGELDAATVPTLEDRLSSFQAATRAVVLDLGQLAFMDAAALGAFERARARATQDGLVFALRDPSAVARRILDVAGMAGCVSEGDEWEPGSDPQPRPMVGTP